VFLLVLALIVGGVGAQATGLLNTESGGYLVCVNSATKVVTHPGTSSCPKGSKKLLLGAQGAAGAIGLTGATGLSGKDGIDGKDGKTLWNGVIDPESTWGAPGDVFINSATQTLFGPKNLDGTWPAGVSMVGPKGDQGLTGLTGAQGPIGLTGLTGAQGPIGLTGLTGAQGPIGLTGLTGAQGPIGLTGATGAQGPGGASGGSGPAGAAGAQGPIGLPGLTGAPGLAGSDGTNATIAITESFECDGPDDDTVADEKCKIGMTGPGGGLIFFVDYNDQYAEFDYLEAAPQSCEAQRRWSSSNTSASGAGGWGARAVGAGPANTDAIKEFFEDDNESNNAAHFATFCGKGGGVSTESDWFLGSLGEMKLMYDNLQGLGDFVGGYYWSSSENSGFLAWSQNFNTGGLLNNLKSFSFSVRPVRRF
jgi:hypothetical protein